MQRFILFILTVILMTGCGHEEQKKTEPAKVSSPVKESDLTTIKLTPDAEKRLGIQLYEVKKEKLNQVRVLGGEVQAIPGQSTSLVAPLQGTLVLPENGFIPLTGKEVKKGQLLYRLVILPAERDLLSVKNEFEMQQVQLETAQSKAKRTEQLLKDGAVSEKQNEQAIADLAAARQAYNDAKSRYNLLEDGSVNSSPDNAAYRIESPINGIIQRIYAGPSQVITAGMPIMNVSAISPVWIKVQIYTGDLQNIDLNQPARIQSLGNTKGKNFLEAKPVTAPIPSTGSSLTDIYFEFPNKDRFFLLGEKVNVYLNLDNSDSRIAIPYSSILYDFNGGQWVYVNTGPQTYVRQRVEVHNVSNGMAVISHGIEIGLKVVTAGSAELFGTEFGGNK